MVSQYPYKLEVFVQAESVYDENTGEWVGGNEGWQDWGKCRDEVNGSGSKISTEDGIIYEYSWSVYMPLNTKRIAKGTKIRVTDLEGNVRLEKEILRFMKDQFHCRLWV